MNILSMACACPHSTEACVAVAWYVDQLERGISHEALLRDAMIAVGSEPLYRLADRWSTSYPKFARDVRQVHAMNLAAVDGAKHARATAAAAELRQQLIHVQALIDRA